MHIFICSIAFASIISTTWANKKLCKVPEVPNGKVQRLVPGQFTNTQEFKKVPVGTELDDKEVLWLLCEKGYSALGQGDWLAKVSCNGGKWSIEPFCEPDQNPSIFSTTTVFPDFTTTTETSELSSLPTYESGTQTEHTTSETSTEAYFCNCTYNYMNKNVLVYANGKKLSFGSQVKKGDKATITCLDEMDILIWNNGARASGAVDINCDTCESWSDRDIPQCEPFNKDNNPSIFSTTTVLTDFTSTTETSELSSFPANESETKPELTTSETSTEASICSCTYNYMNEKVLAYANGKKLSFGSQVKKGDKATIACLDEMDILIWNNGSRASGAVDINCDTCESWSDRDIPHCEPFNKDACQVPFVENGAILRYEKYRWGRKRKGIKIEEGEILDKVDIGETVMLSCNAGFFPEGFPGASRHQISCEDGTWSTSLKCISASCDGDPPPMENGTPVVSKRTHGHIIYYTCDRHYVNTKAGLVKCYYGTWRGHTPTCTYGGCSLYQLNFPGLRKPLNKEIFSHDQSLAINCEEGYKKRGLKSKIYCNMGKWQINYNPCVKV